MAEFSMPFDSVEIEPNVYDREYNALEFAKYLGGLVETGVMRGAMQELKLSNTGANMQTIMATGIAYIAVNGAVHYYENDSPLTLTHDTESIGLNRMDRIVLRLDLNTSERQIKAVIKKGVAAASPVAPTLTQNNLVHEISIGQVRITGGQTFIAANAITQHIGTVTAWATSKILPNYDDATLQAVLNTVSAHKDNTVIHTPYGVHLHFEIIKHKTFTNEWSKKCNPLLLLVDPKTKEWQQWLKELGYYKGAIDGIYGDSTIKVVLDYQKANKLGADGVCGRTTYAHIKNAHGKLDKKPSKSPADETLYRLFTGTFKTKVAAEKALDTIKQKLGWTCYLDKVNCSYRVKTGTFIGKVSADNAAARIKKEGIASIVHVSKA